MDIERQPFDLRECVESALDLIGPRAAEKHLDIAYVFEGEVPAGDRRRRDAAAADPAQPAEPTRSSSPSKGEVVLTRARRGRRADRRRQPAALRRARHRHRPDEPKAWRGCSSRSARPTSHHAQVRRHRAGPGHQQAAGRADGRHDVGRERRAGQGLRPSTSPSARAGRAAAGHSGATSSASSPQLHGQARPGGRRQRHQPAHPGAADGQVGHGGARHRVPGAGAAAGSRRESLRPRHPRHAHARAWTARTLAATHPRGRPHAAAGAVQLARPARRPATAVCSPPPGQAAAPEPAVRHAGDAAGARRGAAGRATRGQAAHGRRHGRSATRCASCWPRTTW